MEVTDRVSVEPGDPHEWSKHVVVQTPQSCTFITYVTPSCNVPVVLFGEVLLQEGWDWYT